MAFLRSGCPSHMKEHPNQTTTRKKSVFVRYVIPVKWQTSPLDSAWLPRKLLRAHKKKNCCRRLECLTFSKSLSCTIWKFRYFFGRKIGSHGWNCWLDALSHPLSYIMHPQTWHTLICFGVEGGCSEDCENCLWGAESWASTIRQVGGGKIRHGRTPDARRAHDPSWQILRQMRFTDD